MVDEKQLQSIEDYLRLYLAPTPCLELGLNGFNGTSCTRESLLSILIIYMNLYVRTNEHSLDSTTPTFLFLSIAFSFSLSISLYLLLCSLTVATVSTSVQFMKFFDLYFVSFGKTPRVLVGYMFVAI